MKTFFSENDTPITLMTRDDFEYKDLKSELYYTNWETVVINEFFCENGIVYIKGMLRSKSVGFIDFDFIKNPKYFPRVNSYGYCTLISSAADFDKVNVIEIKPDGKFYYWLSGELQYGVPFTVMYPMKLS